MEDPSFAWNMTGNVEMVGGEEQNKKKRKAEALWRQGKGFIDIFMGVF